MKLKGANGASVCGAPGSREPQEHIGSPADGIWENPCPSDRWLAALKLVLEGERQKEIFSRALRPPPQLPRLYRKTGRDSGDTSWLGMCVKWTPSAQRMHLLLLQAPTRLSLQRTGVAFYDHLLMTTSSLALPSLSRLRIPF